jgi:signal transduction histidine kinase
MLATGVFLTVTTDSRLVILSVIVSIIGSYTALDMAQQVLYTQNINRRWWIIGSGVSLGITIWGMHFTAILAHQLKIPIGYDFNIVLLSMIVAIAGAVVGFCIISRPGESGLIPLLSASIFIGGGIIIMHFTAMSALRLAAVMSYDLRLVTLSSAVAIIFSFIALWLKLHFRNYGILSDSYRLIGSALLMGVAISGMHYIAMLAVRFQPAELIKSKFSVIDNYFLSLVIGINALIMLVLALLASSFARHLRVEIAKTEVLLQAEASLEKLVEKRTEELAEEKLISEAASRAKTEFLANMNHELRTPLSNIINLSSVLLDEVFGSLNDRQKQYVNAIYTSGYDLLELINELLDLAKIEAGRQELYLEPICLEEVCRESIASVEAQANSRGLELSLEIAPDVTICMADRRRVKQILLNLLSNAIKFTNRGYVKLKVDKESNYLRLMVIDTGIGIAAENLAKLFKPFEQINRGLNSKYGGTGLGLALSKNLASLHGGDITVESELGRGSCFTLILSANLPGTIDD